MTTLLLTVGMAGRWSLKPPLDTYLLRNVIYTCRAIRSISDYLAHDEDPFQLIYSRLSLLEEDYQRDVRNNVSIVSLQSDNGQWYLIPESYILDYPDNTGVPYQNLMIGVALKKVPQNLDIAALIQTFKSDVFDILGIEAEIKTAVIGSTFLVSEEEHDNLTQERINIKNVLYTDRTRIRVLEEQNTALVNLLNQLQNCMTSSCIIGNGRICLPTYNQDTPGDTGRIDAADYLYFNDPPYMNPIDLYLFGERKYKRLLLNPHQVEIIRSDPIDPEDMPPPTPGEDDSLDPDDFTIVTPKTQHSMNAVDLFLMQNIFQDEDISFGKNKLYRCQLHQFILGMSGILLEYQPQPMIKFNTIHLQR